MSEHVENLNKLRAMIVEHRRAHASNALTGDPLNAAANIAEMQQLLEAIDDAIEDEKDPGRKSPVAASGASRRT